ncbi:52 kDa repressor of the inhibitor of the protein kinase-like isoform X1 [Xenia sp. Carnegie-2017]|uniref:52 kDa repressor of the inhibitor of the protein kinase-like isoform X1 n=1 Tax=Xenia sp. Carnegie-2017 TaxID=2897299 RepID=UPI001F04EBB5|nr:52 kDa repressor of the inhibitor of the protein kinase-like isoform X1 [Xenia sp. Carnegie-2017]XP_046854934.1 52 kDa repressor of the inhibitor of the protein kinase-like isoform X1 [Xenia sp. Carnegie-2017]
MGLHAFTSPIFNNIRSQMSGVAQLIENILDTNIKLEIEQNRKILKQIVDTVLFCGRLGIGLRGHCDDAQFHPEFGCYSVNGNVCNFVESLNFRVRAGDQTLKNHLLKCGKNKSYISKTSQNKIINCIGQVISEDIINETKKNRYYSIIADEAADSSHKEQLSLVLRFVDSSMNVKEEFMCFLHCKWGLSGQQLSKLILETLEKFALPIMDCRGQGYDGAGAVSGHINGLAAHILRTNPKALYTHCYSHRLNLCVCDTLSNVEINNMLSVVSQAANFINISQTRNIPFAVHVKKSDVRTKKAKLVSLCKTRWVERVDGLDTFQQLFIPLIDTLQDMINNLLQEIFLMRLFQSRNCCREKLLMLWMVFI